MIKKYTSILSDCIAIFFLFAFAIFIQQHTLINWDASWHLLGAKRILAGGASYSSNLFDDNLPMVFWFFIPAVFIHQKTHIDLLLLCNLSVDLVILTSFLLCNFFLNAIYTSKKTLEKRIISYAILLILLIGPCYEFAQRDTLVITFLFPYITLIAADIKKPIQKHTMIRIVVGVFAAVGICMNIFYTLLIVMLGIQRSVYQKKIRVFQPEFASGFFVVLLYFLFMGIFYHDYFTTIIPAFIAFSSINNSSLSEILLCCGALLFYTTTIVFFVNFTRSKNSWFFTMWLATLASFIIFFIHQKVWESHLVAVFFTTYLLLFMLTVDAVPHRKKLSWKNQLVFIASILSLLYGFSLFVIYEITYSFYFFGKESNSYQLIQFFNQQPKNSSFYAFSYEHVSIFVFLPYTTLNYLPAGPNLWTLVHINPISSWALEQQTLARRRIVHDFEYKKPDFVLVNVSKENQHFLPNFIESLQQDKVFRQQWQCYHVVKKIGVHEIYARTHLKKYCS